MVRLTDTYCALLDKTVALGASPRFFASFLTCACGVALIASFRYVTAGPAWTYLLRLP